MFKNRGNIFGRMKILYTKSGVYVLIFLSIFVLIGVSTSIKPMYRLSSQLVTNWTSDIDRSVFLYLLEKEHHVFQLLSKDETSFPNLSSVIFKLATNIKPDEPRSFLGREIPGLSNIGQKIIIAGEGTSYTTLSIESSPPLEDVLKEREAIFDEKEDEENEAFEQPEEKVIFIYNTHNRESFLPHLPDETDPHSAYHDEVNITKVSEKLAHLLEQKGIGTYVDDTDFMHILNDRSLSYGKSYEVSRPIVEEALAQNGDLQYIFDIHRDSLPREQTTKQIDGVDYAKILFVIGSGYDSYEKNLTLAKELHYMIEEQFPGLSRGVLTKEGAGNNGIYNQDLSSNSLLIEIGGYENSLEELYRSVEVFSQVFSDFYWEAEKVDGNF